MVNDTALVGQVMAMVGYRPHAFAGPTLLVKTRGLSRWDFWFFSPWRRLFKEGLSERLIPGLHGSIFDSKQVAQLAEVLRDAIRLR
jgi:hypothetical protein